MPLSFDETAKKLECYDRGRLRTMTFFSRQWTFFTEPIEQCCEKLECIDDGNGARQFFLTKKSETTFYIPQKLECYGCEGMSTLSCFRANEAPTDESPPLFWDKTHFFHGNGKQKPFFSEYGGWKQKNADPDLLFREKYRITHVTEWRGSRLDSRNWRP